MRKQKAERSNRERQSCNHRLAGCITLFLNFCFLLSASSQVIPANRLANWAPNSTVGVVGGIPWRTNIIEANQAPYNADPTGNTPCGYPSGAIQLAINTATNGQVVHLTNGTYDIRTGLFFNRNQVSLRGDGSNTVLVGSMTVGQSENGNYIPGYAIAVASGTTAGSTNLVFVQNQDTNGTTIVPGDSFEIASIVQSSDLPNFKYIVSRGGEIAAGQQYGLRQSVMITGVTNGTNYSFWPPLAWNFTNAPVAFPQNLVGIFSQQQRFGVGLENFTLTSSNGVLDGATTVMCYMEMLQDSWVTNVNFLWGYNYSIQFLCNENVSFVGSRIDHARNVGTSDLSGILMEFSSGCAFENNIFADGLSPAIEWDNGVTFNAFAYNLFTNNFSDMDMHVTHPAMNLWEGNIMGGVEEDSYYGSSSHNTYFRNRFLGTVALNRWATYDAAVGNVIGNPNFSYQYEPTNSGFGGMGISAIFAIGFPNEGNTSYDGTSPPNPYNFPGWNYTGFSGEAMSNGFFVVTNTQVNTNVLTGLFTNIPVVCTNFDGHGGCDCQLYVLVGQDPSNTNKYWPIGNPPTCSGPTLTNVAMAQNETVSNGWRIFQMNQITCEWLQLSNLPTHILTGNDVMTNQSSFVTVWDANGVQSLPTSYLYPNGAPSYWGTNAWPAIDPASTPKVAMIPAQERFLGISGGNIGGGGSPPTNPGPGSGQAVIIHAAFPAAP